MTRLALGLIGGDFGARGSKPFGDVAPIALLSSKSEASAIEPSPTPHWRKNHLRVMSRAYSERRSIDRFTEFIGTHSFVIVSSRFKIVLLTIAQAATLCRFTSSGIALRSGTATFTASEEWFSK